MKSAIEKLFHGQLGNFEFVNRSEKEESDLDEVVKNDKKLMEIIKDNHEAMDIFMQLKEAIEKCDCDELLRFYKEGFRNGFLLALDVLDE